MTANPGNSVEGEDKIVVGEKQEPLRQSSRPPRTLTHRMNLSEVRAAFFEAGLIQPELERRPSQPPRSAPVHTQTSASNIQKRKQEIALEHTENQQHVKPNVPGTQQHGARVTSELSYAQKCAMNGGTAVVAGSILMLAWKGMTRWIG